MVQCVHSLAVALSGSPAGLKTYADEITMQFEVDSFQGQRPDAPNTRILF